MKKMLISLAVVSGLLVGSNAWARVVVHAGPVHVGVGRPAVRPVPVHRPVHVAPRPVVARPPVLRPPVVAAPRPVVVAAPRPVVVAAPRPVVTAPQIVTVPAPIPVPATTAANATLRARRLLNAIHREVEEAVEDALQSQNQ